MSSKEINLIEPKRPLTEQQERLRKVMTWWLPIVLVGYSILVAVVFGIGVYQQLRLSRLTADIDKEKTLITANQQDEGLFRLLKQKTQALTNILNSRYPYQEIYQLFRQLTSEGAVLNSLKISEDGKVALEITALDAYQLDQYVNRLLQAAKQRFEYVSLLSVNHLPQGNYVVNFEIAMVKS